MLILECPKLLVRECNTRWALTSKSYCRCSRDGMMTGQCGQQGSELTQSWRFGPRCSRWQKRKQRRSRWLGRLLMRVDWATSSVLVLLMKTEGKAFSMVHLTAREAGAEVRLGGFYTQNTRDLLEHVWETWHVMWCARENTG